MDKVEIMGFQCVYVDSTVKQNERQRGKKRDGQEMCVGPGERGREFGEREEKIHMKSTAGGLERKP